MNNLIRANELTFSNNNQWYKNNVLLLKPERRNFTPVKDYERYILLCSEKRQRNSFETFPRLQKCP